MPTISIIVPVYNVEKYLEECLDSILAQTFKDFEVICVDDDSTDKSIEILKKYALKDRRIIIIKGNHSGAGEARNKGIKIAKGKYIQFLDSDDYFEPTLLEELYTRTQKHNADLVVCSSRNIDEQGTITERKNPNSPINLDKTPLEKVFSRKDFPEMIFSLLAPIPWNKLYKRELILDNEITFPNLRISEDVTFVNACVASAERIVVCDKELVNYRFNRSGNMLSYRADYSIDVVHACNALQNYLMKQGLYEKLKTAFITAFENYIRWETALCNEKQYHLFLKEFKALMPNDWKLFNAALRKDYITPKYLKEIIGNKKVMLWGASIFLRKVLEKETEKNPNILGIIDKNPVSWGKAFGNYKIYPPESLYDLKPDGVIMTILSNYKINYPILQKEFQEKYKEVELFPNIFDKDIQFE